MVTDVEVLKKKARKLAASKVLEGGSAAVFLPLGELQGCDVRIAAGYGAPAEEPKAGPGDRLIWILDGYAEVHRADGQTTQISQGESMVLPAGKAYRLVFPTLTIFLDVEVRGHG